MCVILVRKPLEYQGGEREGGERRKREEKERQGKKNLWGHERGGEGTGREGRREGRREGGGRARGRGGGDPERAISTVFSDSLSLSLLPSLLPLPLTETQTHRHTRTNTNPHTHTQTQTQPTNLCGRIRKRWLALNSRSVRARFTLARSLLAAAFCLSPSLALPSPPPRTFAMCSPNLLRTCWWLCAPWSCWCSRWCTLNWCTRRAHQGGMSKGLDSVAQCARGGVLCADVDSGEEEGGWRGRGGGGRSRGG